MVTPACMASYIDRPPLLMDWLTTTTCHASAKLHVTRPACWPASGCEPAGWRGAGRVQLPHPFPLQICSTDAGCSTVPDGSLGLDIFPGKLYVDAAKGPLSGAPSVCTWPGVLSRRFPGLALIAVRYKARHALPHAPPCGRLPPDRSGRAAGALQKSTSIQSRRASRGPRPPQRRIHVPGCSASACTVR